MLTRHDKGRLIAPALNQLGWQLTELNSFDTDSLGSFAGEYPRFMTAQECAFRKAALAAELSGLDIGLGSEGSFSIEACGTPTNLIRQRQANCARCDHTIITPVAAHHASQQYCQECNP
tara:strand:- start:2464 stop:2820 length:357 start_codon:yes stop_codon:yes gene_type:complete